MAVTTEAILAESAQIGLQIIGIHPKRGFYGITADDGSPMGDFLAQATVSEDHSDDMEVTEHPLEQGSAINDHAYKRPAEVTLHLGWSNSPSQSASLGQAALGVGSALNQTFNKVLNAANVATSALALFNGQTGNYLQQIYQALLALQTRRALFVLYTGKRVYTDMFCKSLTVTTDERTENALMVTVVCKQILFVSTQAVTLPSATQANPQATASPVQRGTISPYIAKAGS